RENCGHGARELPGQMIFRDHEGNVLRHAVIAPNLQDAFHELRYPIEILPGDGTGLKRIVLEGNEREIGKMVVVYLKDHNHLSDLAFVSFEHYPFEPCIVTWKDLYREPQLMNGILQI